MKRLMVMIAIVSVLAMAPQAFAAGSTVINLGSSGSITADFTINYQPLGTGSYVDNVFPDNENYTFSIGSGLIDYQSHGEGWYLNHPSYNVGGVWNSSNHLDGKHPWGTLEDDPGNGAFVGQSYTPTGSAPDYGVVGSNAQWTITYAVNAPVSNALIQHTILAGTVSNLSTTGNITTALLTVYDTAYRGYGTSPGLDTYSGGAYQGFDMNQEPSGRLSAGVYLYSWDGATSTGTLSPVPEPLTMIAVSMGIAGLGGYIRRRTRRAVA